MTPELWTAIGVFVVAISALIVKAMVRTVVVREGTAALHFRDGKYVRTLGAGRYRFWGSRDVVESVDLRTISQVIGNQEIATKDGVPVKVSLIVQFAVSDAYAFKTKFYDAYTEMHQAVQVALRDAVSALGVEEFVENRARVAEPVLETARAVAAGLGIALNSVQVRDVVIGGGIKAAMADIVRAQFEGRAALERARAEAATTRSLANTARMLEEQPALAQLRLIQAVESGKATVVIGEDKLVRPK